MTSAKKPSPPVRHIETVPVVTLEHGHLFARGWFEGNALDALDETEILVWPPLDGPDAAQVRCPRPRR